MKKLAEFGTSAQDFGKRRIMSKSLHPCKGQKGCDQNVFYKENCRIGCVSDMKLLGEQETELD